MWVRTSIRPFSSSTGYGMDMILICNWSILNEKHRLKGVFLWVRTSIRAFTSSAGYGMDMKLMCNWSIFNEKHGLKGVHCEFELLLDHVPIVLDMKWIWIWSVFFYLWPMENID